MSNLGLLVATQNGDGKGEGKGASSPASVTPPYISGHLYQVVQMTGLDGKNLMQLLPVSKPVENLKPVVLSPVMSQGLKGNVSGYPYHNVKPLLTNTTTTPVDKTTALKTSLSQPIVLLKPLGQLENIKIASVAKENPAASTVSGIQGSYSADRLSLQKINAPASSDTSVSDTSILSTRNIPLSGKSPTLLSGHHLQIPAHAEVKSVPATFLPPAIQQEILAKAASSNTSRTYDVTNPPTVIFVSPVNTVRMPVSTPLQNISRQPVAGILNSLVLTTPQKAVSKSAIEISASGSGKNQRSPLKWVVHEHPQSSASCLVPVKSSNSTASKILKALGDKKNTQSSPASILPACSNSLEKSHVKTIIKNDNALVMYDGNVYFLIKKEGNVLSATNHGKPEATPIKKQTSAFSPATNSTITNQVVNLVLSKSRGIASNVKDPKSHGNTIPLLESEVKKSLISESTLSVIPCDNLQISSTSQQRVTPLSDTVSDGITTLQSASVCSTVPKAVTSKVEANAVLLPSEHDTPKAVAEKMEITSGIPTEMKHRKKQQNPQYLHLRKKFGLFKEERVYLTRIVSIPPTSSEATGGVDSTQMNETCDLIHLMPMENGKEEKIFREQREELNTKRKIRSPILENAKKKKNVETVLDSMLESYSVLKRPIQPHVVSEHETPTSFLQCSHREDWVSNTCVPSNEENSVLNPTLFCREKEVAVNEESFKEDPFPFSPPDLEETIKDEKIMRLKNLLREQEEALEALRGKKRQS